MQRQGHHGCIDPTEESTSAGRGASKVLSAVLFGSVNDSRLRHRTLTQHGPHTHAPGAFTFDIIPTRIPTSDSLLEMSCPV
jgi:hypothetical protein